MEGAGGRCQEVQAPLGVAGSKAHGGAGTDSAGSRVAITEGSPVVLY